MTPEQEVWLDDTENTCAYLYEGGTAWSIGHVGDIDCGLVIASSNLESIFLSHLTVSNLRAGIASSEIEQLRTYLSGVDDGNRLFLVSREVDGEDGQDEWDMLGEVLGMGVVRFSIRGLGNVVPYNIRVRHLGDKLDIKAVEGGEMSRVLLNERVNL